MWQALGKAVLKYRKVFITIMVLLTAFLGYHASKVQMSYDFSRAIPTDHPKYLAYLDFKKTFGEDGNLLTIGFTTDSFFTTEKFSKLQAFQKQLKEINGVEDILSIPGAVTLKKNDSSGKLDALKIFDEHSTNQAVLDSQKNIFLSLPFYRGLLYNRETNAFLIGVRINSTILGTKAREKTIGAIEEASEAFRASTGYDIHLSGLPLIRTNVAVRIAKEMQFFLLGSILLSALILYIFFRSFSNTLLSLTVVIIGVVYSLATIQMLGYKITL